MDMKLNGQLVRKLRLKHSWSQEMLAEKSGLNQRTIQRVETEGSGSLRTRQALASVLDVDPDVLDATPVEETFAVSNHSHDSTLLGKFQAYLESRESYEFILLILLTIFFVASRPFYFSLSRFNFSWINFSVGNRPFVAMPLWWCYTILFWLMLALPWLAVIRKTCPRFLSWHMIAMGLALLLSVVQLWQQTLVMETVAFCLYYASLLLLMNLFVTKNHSTSFRHLVTSILRCYVFLWCFLALSHYFLMSTAVFMLLDKDFPPLAVTGNTILRDMGKLTQLIPVGLVLLYAMHHDRKAGGRPASVVQHKIRDTGLSTDQENTISPSSISTLMASPGA